MIRSRGTEAVLVVANKYYEDDPRLQREVEALLDSGYHVCLLCPRRRHRGKEWGHRFDSRFEIISLPLERRRGSRVRYLVEYLIYFGFIAIMSTKLYRQSRYKVIQVFVMPEALVLACLLPKILGAKILMDWMDPMAEVFLSMYRSKSDKLVLLLIRFFERTAVRLADKIIVPNLGFQEAFVQRGCPVEKISIVMNAADERVFCVDRENVLIREEGPPVLLYTGTILERGGLDLAIHAMREISAQVPDVRLHVLGGGREDYVGRCVSLVRALDLEERVLFKGQVALAELPAAMNGAIMGVIPNRPNPFTNINFPTRICEYATLRLPMVVPSLPGIRDYLDEKSACFFRPGDCSDLARAIMDLLGNGELRQSLAHEAFNVSRRLAWTGQKETYLKVMQGLFAED